MESIRREKFREIDLYLLSPVFFRLDKNFLPCVCIVIVLKKRKSLTETVTYFKRAKSENLKSPDQIAHQIC